jgi:hypothetical protein
MKQPNNSFNASGISLPFIVSLSHDALVSRRVNSGVRFLLNTEAQKLNHTS